LKSIEIINYIDSLNEDAYGTFTVGQLYTKLGHNGFMKYVKDVTASVLRRLNTISPTKTVIPKLDANSIEYIAEVGHFTDSLSIALASFNSLKVLRIVYNGDMSQILFEQKDLALLLSQNINRLYGDPDAKKYIECIMNLPSDKTESSDYDKYSFEDLVNYVSFNKLKPYFQESFKEALKASVYVPMSSVGDLREASVTIKSSGDRKAIECTSVTHITSLDFVAEFFKLSFTIEHGSLESTLDISYCVSCDIDGAKREAKASARVRSQSPNVKKQFKNSINACLLARNVSDTKIGIIVLIKKGK
jgi:hypothetical protein